MPKEASNALMLVGHGSSQYANAGRLLHWHAARIGARRIFGRVGVGLLAGEPSVPEALAALGPGPIRVVPFFMEEGYFTRIAVPRAIGGRDNVRICAPVGVHPTVAHIMSGMARQGAEAQGLPVAACVVVLVGHGSATTPGRPLELHRHAATVSRSGVFRRCVAACLEEPPLLPDVLRQNSTEPVIVIGFFAGEGMHVRDDVPAAIDAENARRGVAGPPVRFHGSVASDPAMTEIILDQAHSNIARNAARRG